MCEVTHATKRRGDVACGVPGRRGCFVSWIEDLEAECGGTQKLFSIGRLDKPTTGLLLVTNNGDLDYAVTRRGACTKQYVVTTNSKPTEAGPTLSSALF